MQLRTLFLYLIGNRQAILKIAACRNALWVGLLFVFSAALAREYDGRDLLAEPWYLLIPLGASLIAATLLFLLIFGALLFNQKGRPPFFTAYRSFLTLFWMTAPLAWLYAIPYERFLPIGRATEANLRTLGLVALWRVALMIRVTSVLTGRSIKSSLCLVMLLADGVALAAIYFLPVPIIPFMGGVRLTSSESAVVGAVVLVVQLGLLSALVWLCGTLSTYWQERLTWQVTEHNPEKCVVGRGPWCLAVLSLLVWLPILPWTQLEQQLRSQVESDMKEGRIAEAIDTMSAHKQSDFPPDWDPPPRIAYRNQDVNLLDVLEVALAQDTASWVYEVYVNKLRRLISDQFIMLNNLRGKKDALHLLKVVTRLPEGEAIAAHNFETLEHLFSTVSGELTEVERLPIADFLDRVRNKVKATK